MYNKTKWWRYLLALLVFWLTPVLAIAILRLAYGFFNILAPKAYQNTSTMITVLADIMGISLCCHLANKILDEAHPMFCMVNAIIAAVLWGLMLVGIVWSEIRLSQFSLISILPSAACFGTYLAHAISYHGDI